MKKKSIIIFLISMVILVGAFTYYYGSVKKWKGSDLGQVEDSNDDHDFMEDEDELGNQEEQDGHSQQEEVEKDSTEDLVEEEAEEEVEPPKKITMAFAGDILFADNSVPINKYDSVGKGIDGILSANLIKKMRKADIMMLNNEFAYSTRGEKIEGKSYTFRAHPERVNILHEMGVDIVSLANNHALDFGPDALLDTFETLDDAGIDYVGAGPNMDRAKDAIYHTIEDKTIAFLSASRVIYAGDWYATDTRAGMLGTYDPAILIEEIKLAKGKSDYIVVYVHWGVEGDNKPQEYQRTMAQQYIDAGADVVIGAHPHIMQGFEYYQGKPIIYSLGNFWFSSYKRESGLLEIILEPEGTVDVKIVPVMTGDSYTYMLENEDDIKKYYQYMSDISFGVSIDENGLITEEIE